MVGTFHLVAFTQETADVNALVFIARAEGTHVYVCESYGALRVNRKLIRGCTCMRASEGP